MSSIEFIDVSNPHAPPPPPPQSPLFWPSTRERLILVFETRDDNGISVWGIDPVGHTLPFHAELQPDQKDPFIDAVKRGDEPVELPANATAQVGNDNSRTPRTTHSLDNAIVIIDSGGEPKGPRYQLNLTTALQTSSKASTLTARNKGR